MPHAESADFTQDTIKRETTQQPVISIIIPVYNREKAIHHCLNKLKHCHYDKRNIELILIDDCSTDNSYHVLQRFISDFPNIIILRRRVNSGGASRPRNNGLQVASGKWVLFIDSDDYITPHALTDALALAQSDPHIDMVCMPYFRAEGSSRAISRSAFHYQDNVSGLTFTQTKLYRSLTVFGKLLRTDLIRKHSINFPDNIPVREDNWFMMKMYCIVSNIAILGNRKQYYFINEADNISLAAKGTSPANAVEIYLSAYDFIHSQHHLSQTEQHDILALYLNRFTNMIQRGKHAPRLFYSKTKDTLLDLIDNPFLSQAARDFIFTLFAGQYDAETPHHTALAHLITLARPELNRLHLSPQPTPFPEYVLFFSICNGLERASTLCVQGQTLDKAWLKGILALREWQETQTREPIWLRVDAVDKIETLNWETLQEKLSRTKRNYFRFGLSFDYRFQYAILEHELLANAMLYQQTEGVAAPNPINLANYSRKKFARELGWPTRPEQLLWRFTTRSLFTDGKQVYPIEASGKRAGYRQLSRWQDELDPMIFSAADYLRRQAQESGRYHYGWFPCFDKPIKGYNTVRHAGSTYALLEGWEVTQDPGQFTVIERALAYLSTALIQTRRLPDGSEADFLIDTGEEIKLGGNAVSILAFAKYTEISGDQRYLPQMQRLANGISFMQIEETGGFNHVYHAGDLSLKAQHRTIYYDGEATFALMRLYGLTKEARWLDIVERAIEHFIAHKHWRAHDHWMGYGVNELTLYRPQERYYKFGLDNVRDHLDFVINRVTTYPTLLELMMAASRMITRLADSEFRYLLDDFDTAKFEVALEARARYLTNGFFWPELAMFFKKPDRIEGSFFIRHHRVHVRIDDIGHYLSGYVAYRKYWREQHDFTA
ncbi:glycosyltransferase family 2 protein [Pseudocitrobacter cyperus]|uniref:Glycosyltransferase n=1 Tax=Pseudocitrobacter cyperus TaxID=3112843 RepID=A0ABV0HNP7_9ENTR